jgi:hypothetical protein
MFLRRRWSISEAFLVAAVVGAASPLLDAFLYRSFDVEIAHFIFPIIGLVLLGLVYWRTERSQFRGDRRAMTGTIGASLIWVLGVVGSGWCCTRHICMGGHMEHPPYPAWHYAIDVGWVLSLIVASLWVRFLRVSVCIAFAALSSFLISYRFLFGSLGGMYEWLPL